ncbi:hypothetical protein BLOT_015245 [Blomia tropicalis]|nr:hypothetical protein BLOT_015245 [Blomia tropicalis]
MASNNIINGYHLKGIILCCLFVVHSSIHCFTIHHETPANEHSRPSKMDNPLNDKFNSIKRTSYEMGSEPGEKDPPKPNVFFSEPPMGNMNSMSMPMTTHFENMQPNYIGPNYLVNHGLINRNLQDDSMMSQGTNSMLSYGPGGNNLPGILPYYQGFNKHLKRHGNAGLAGKVIGELIGIKIRESIEGLGKSFSEYAKDFTSKNFVNLGQVFSRVLKYQ